MNDKSKLELIGEIAEANNKNLELIQEINQLQSNWNSLREWLEEEHAIVKSNSIQEPNNPEWYIKWNERKKVLDKMNELEGGDNEK